MRIERISEGAEAPQNLLAAALDSLFSADGKWDAPGRDREIAKLLLDLTGANSVSVLAGSADGPEVAKAGRSAEIETIRTFANRVDRSTNSYVEGRWIGTKVALDANRIGLVVLDLSGASQIAFAMAQERLELFRALCKATALASAFKPTPELVELASTLAMGDQNAAQRFLDQLSVAARRDDLKLALLKSGKLTKLFVPSQADVALRSELLAKVASHLTERAASQAEVPEVLFLGDGASLALLKDGQEPINPDVVAFLEAVFKGRRTTGRFGARVWRAAKVALIFAGLAALLLIPIDDDINLDATIEPAGQTRVTVPFNGRILDVLVETGDRVKAGETILASMDMRDLDRELTELQTEQAGVISRLSTARNDRDAAAAREAELSIELLDIRIASVEAKRAAGTIYAPIDGVVQMHDEAELKGSFAGLGTVILHVSHATDVRVATPLSPRALAVLSDGADGAFRPDANPTAATAFSVERISHLPDETGGQRTRMSYSNALSIAETDGLVVGMRGVAQFTLDRKPLGQLVWERFRDWLLIVLWR